MEGDVGIALAVRQGVIGLQRLAQGLAFRWQTEGQHGGVAAEQSGPGSALEIVRHDDAVAGGLRDMDMAVDAAGQDELAARIDLAPGAAEVPTELDDLAALDGDIRLEHVRCRRDRAAADDEVERHRLVSCPCPAFMR